jgi:hypothetical protein
MGEPDTAPDVIDECVLRVSGVGHCIMMRSRFLAGTDSVYAAVYVPTSKNAAQRLALTTVDNRNLSFWPERKGNDLGRDLTAWDQAKFQS